WGVVPSPNLGTDSNLLNGVAAVSSSDAWAVGYYGEYTVAQTLIEHWNGSAWIMFPSPNVDARTNVLNGVAAVSSSDAWAVGYYFSNAFVYQTLIEHWDGSGWSAIPSPSVGIRDNVLYGVAVGSSSDVWAVGEYRDGSGEYQTLIEHWNGSAWSVVPSPNVGN